MSAPPPELARLVAAHRVVNRPDPRLRDRVRAAVDLDHRRRQTRRWLTGAALGAAIGLAALFVMRCAHISSSRMQSVPADVDPHGAAYERDDAGSEAGVAVPGVPPAARVDRAHDRPTTPPSPPPIRSEPPAVARDRSQSPRGAASSGDGEREVRLLREAEVALKDDPDAALATLARHAREFPTTTLSVEREALTVLALCAADRAIEGRGRRATFLKTHEHSAYAGRVRAACDDR